MEKKTAERILSLAAALKADAAEVFLRSYSSTSVEVKDQQVDAFERARDIGAGLRVLAGSRMGFSFTTDLSENALKTLAQAAITNAQTTEPDLYHSLPARSASPYPPARIYDPELVALTEK